MSHQRSYLRDLRKQWDPGDDATVEEYEELPLASDCVAVVGERR